MKIQGTQLLGEKMQKEVTNHEELLGFIMSWKEAMHTHNLMSHLEDDHLPRMLFARKLRAQYRLL